MERVNVMYVTLRHMASPHISHLTSVQPLLLHTLISFISFSQVLPAHYTTRDPTFPPRFSLLTSIPIATDHSIYYYCITTYPVKYEFAFAVAGETDYKLYLRKFHFYFYLYSYSTFIYTFLGVNGHSSTYSYI